MRVETVVLRNKVSNEVFVAILLEEHSDRFVVQDFSHVYFQNRFVLKRGRVSHYSKDSWVVFEKPIEFSISNNDFDDLVRKSDFEALWSKNNS